MKKVFSLALIALLAMSLVLFTGCEDGAGASGDQGGKKPAEKNTVSISYEYGKGTFSVSVPKNEDGTPKYTFTEERPEGEAEGSFYLETDKAIFGFEIDGLVYQTATKYKEKYGEVKGTFQGYLDWIDDPDSGIRLSGMEKTKIGNRDAIKYYSLEGGGGDYTYYGFNYRVGADDVYPGSAVDILVVYKLDEFPTESQPLDAETLEILNSLTITPTAE